MNKSMRPMMMRLWAFEFIFYFKVDNNLLYCNKDSEAILDDGVCLLFAIDGFL